MLHELKIHAKPIIKAIAQITNVAALLAGSLQATGVLSMLAPKTTVLLTLLIIGINLLAHALKNYVEVTVDVPAAPATTATVAVKAVLTAPTA